MKLKCVKATNSDNDSPSRQLARYIKTATEQYVPQLEVELVYRNDRFLRGGDHTPLAKMDLQLSVCEMNENYDHQHQDLRTEKGLNMATYRNLWILIIYVKRQLLI
jgi:hypothetical protein